MASLPATSLSPGSVWRRRAISPSRPKFTSVARPGTFACSSKPHSVGKIAKVQKNGGAAALTEDKIEGKPTARRKNANTAALTGQAATLPKTASSDATGIRRSTLDPSESTGDGTVP